MDGVEGAPELRYWTKTARPAYYDPVPKLSMLAVVLLACTPASAPPDSAPGSGDGAVAPVAGDTVVPVPVPGTETRVVLAWIPAPEPFWMAVHEVTHDQYAPFRYRRLDDDVAAATFDADAVTRPSLPYEDPVHGMGKGDHPAGGMTRLAALRYARWLSEKTGRLFRLPSEAEWEEACLAGGSGPAIEDLAWYEANSGGAFHPVGEKAPNEWRLHDMHGNVAEWVMEGPPEAWTREQARGRGVVRGGAFDDPPDAVGCDARFEEPAAWKRRDPQIPKSRWWNTDSPHVGFRVVMEPGEWSRSDISAFWARLLDG